jgi:hypothetical protein
VALPSADGSGDFRTFCLRSHFAFDDPIVYPGHPGKAHAHVFFGNTATNANTTPETLESTGNSTCRGGTINRTAYWAPAMVAGGRVVDPAGLVVYYKSGYTGVPKESIIPPPVGLRMIAGDASRMTRPNGWGVFSCDNGEPRSNVISEVPCAPGHQLWMSIGFPQCWDGQNLDSPDHKSHMAYPAGGCPADHPVAIAEITMHVIYNVPATGFTNWRLSSDMYDGPGGYSAHADWMMGWKPDIAQTWTKFCVNAGNDCFAHLLGDGRQMVEFDGN